MLYYLTKMRYYFALCSPLICFALLGIVRIFILPICIKLLSIVDAMQPCIASQQAFCTLFNYFSKIFPPLRPRTICSPPPPFSHPRTSDHFAPVHYKTFCSVLSASKIWHPDPARCVTRKISEKFFWEDAIEMGIKLIFQRGREANNARRRFNIFCRNNIHFLEIIEFV